MGLMVYNEAQNNMKFKNVLLCLAISGLLFSCGKKQEQSLDNVETPTVSVTEVQEETQLENPKDTLKGEETIKQSKDEIDVLLANFEKAAGAYANENRHGEDESILESCRKKAMNLLEKLDKLSGKMTPKQLKKFEEIQSFLPPDNPEM